MIHFLKRDAFSGQLRQPTSKGISPILRAKIRVDGESERCYLKPLPDFILCPITGRKVVNQEIVSEALGYTLAKTSGLSAPSVAGIIALGRDQLPKDLLPELARIGGAPQESYLCWFSKDMEHPNLKQKHLSGINIPALEERRLKRLALFLAKHADSSKIVAFDDWLLNSDRNLGNILQTGLSSLMVIDHGRIFAYPNWEPGSTGSMPWPADNILQSLINHYTPRWSELLPISSGKLMALNAFALSYRPTGLTASRSLLSNFFEPDDVEAIISLLDDRLDPAPHAKAAGLML
jgi:hypothetical protein